MFIGRKKELEILKNNYNKDIFQLTIIYGRRRVGKSTLIKEFIKDKKNVYFSAIKGNIERNIELLSNSVIENLFTEKASVSFKTIYDVFDYIGEYSKKNKLVFVLDELPYLAEAERNILSILQHYIDNIWNNSNLLLILCGSSISFMENEVLSEKSPIFGRRENQINLKPFNYIEAAEFTPGYTLEEKAICYGITGGIAKYLSLIDNKKTLDENIIDLFFKNTGYLYEEPNNLLVQEFRNVSSYNDVINVVASGRNKISEISDKLHIEAASVSIMLNKLIKISIIKKNKAITDENNKKKVLYELSDGMFRFWYRFVPSAITAIELDMGEEYYKKIVKPVINEYMGQIFEEMCREYTLKKGLIGEFNINIDKVGKWWGTDPIKKEVTDIDIVGLDTVNKKCILGECKFTNTKVDIGILKKLQERNGLIDKKYITSGYLLFSKNGFTEGILDENDIYIIDLQELYNL